MQPARGRDDAAGEPQIERQRHDRATAAAAGAIVDQRHRSRCVDLVSPASRRAARASAVSARRSASVMVAVSVPSVSRAAIVVSDGEDDDPQQQAADRIPFDSAQPARARCPGARPRPAEQREIAEPPGRQRDGDDEGDADSGRPNSRPSAGAPPRCRRWLARERSPAQRRDHQRQRREIKQQQARSARPTRSRRTSAPTRRRRQCAMRRS